MNAIQGNDTKWVSVKERLPDADGWYNVKNQDGSETKAHLQKRANGAYIFHIGFFDVPKVTHWSRIVESELKAI